MTRTNRHNTQSVSIGNVQLGAGAAVVVQSMTNTDTADIDATVSQVKLLSDAGSELVRVTVNNEDSARAIPRIVERLAADDYDVLALGVFASVCEFRGVHETAGAQLLTLAAKW